jgi:large subunit ribosomal protein L29
MTTKEIREKTDENLRHELAERQKHLFDLRSQAVTEKLEDPTQIGKTRREIARMKTVLRERQLETVRAEESRKAQEAEAKARAEREAARAEKKRLKAEKLKRWAEKGAAKKPKAAAAGA